MNTHTEETQAGQPTEPDTTRLDVIALLSFVPMDIEIDKDGRTAIITCTWAQAEEYRGLGNGGWTIESDGRGRLDMRVTVPRTALPATDGLLRGVERYVLNAYTRAPIKVTGEGY